MPKLTKEARKYLSKIAKDRHRKMRENDPERYLELQRKASHSRKRYAKLKKS